MKNENKIKHLEFIESVITRMSSNSFGIKGLSMTLVLAVLTAEALINKSIIIVILFIANILLWYLDSYCLFNERMYRKLYDAVRNKKEEDIDFDMNIDIFKLNTKHPVLKVMFSKTEVIYYFIPNIILAAYVTYKIFAFINPVAR